MVPLGRVVQDAGFLHCAGVGGPASKLGIVLSDFIGLSLLETALKAAVLDTRMIKAHYWSHIKPLDTLNAHFIGVPLGSGLMGEVSPILHPVLKSDIVDLLGHLEYVALMRGALHPLVPVLGPLLNLSL